MNGVIKSIFESVTSRLSLVKGEEIFEKSESLYLHIDFGDRVMRFFVYFNAILFTVKISHNINVFFNINFSHRFSTGLNRYK